MATVTYIETNKNSDLTPFALFNLELDASGTDSSKVIFLLAGLTSSGGFIVKNGGPNSDDWENLALWTLEIQADTTEAGIDARCRPVRLSAAGAVLQNGTWTGSQTMGDDRTFTMNTAVDWTDGEEACGNRLAVEVEFTNTDPGTDLNFTMGLGTTENEVDTDVTVGGGTCVPSPSTWTEKTAPAGAWTEKTAPSATWSEKVGLGDNSKMKVEAGTISVAAESLTGEVTLGAHIIDLANAFVVIFPTIVKFDKTNTFYPELIHDGGVTKLRVTRLAVTTVDVVVVGYEVVEGFAGIILKTQSGTATLASGDTSSAITFNAVNTTRALIIAYGAVNGQNSVHKLSYFTAEFTSISSNTSSSATLTRGGSGATGTVHYQIIEFTAGSGVIVQALPEFNLSGNIATGKTQTWTTAVNKPSTWIYPTFRHESNGLEQCNIRVFLDNSTSATFDRYDTTNSYQSYAISFLVTFPTDVSVDHLSDAAVAGDLIENIAVSPVVLANSLAFSTNTIKGTGLKFEQSLWRPHYTTTTNYRHTRLAINQPSEFGIQSINFSGWNFKGWTEKVVT